MPGLSDETPVIALWPNGLYRALETRTFHLLLRHGLKTVGALTASTEDDLRQLPEFGRGMLAEVRRRLADAGLALRDEN